LIIVDSIIKQLLVRMLRDPHFRERLAQDPESALSGFDLNQSWQEAFQRVAEAELTGADAPGADAAELEGKQAEMDRKLVERSVEKADSPAQAKEFLERALRTIQNSQQLKTQDVKSISGGSEAEPTDHAEGRASERLRHKDRSMTSWDYEGLLLESFPRRFVIGCIILAIGAMAWWGMRSLRQNIGQLPPLAIAETVTRTATTTPRAESAFDDEIALAPDPSETPIPQAHALGPTTCRQGPGSIYAPLGYLSEGQAADLLFRNQDGSWLEIKSQNETLERCWVATRLLDLPAAIDVEAMTLGNIPPTPTFTPPPKPEPDEPDDGPQQGCEVWDDNLQDYVCQVPCQQSDPAQYPVCYK
jgi:hypothetical protein